MFKEKREFEVLLNKNIVGDKDILFEDFIHSWLFTVKQPTLKPSSFDRMERVLKEKHVTKLYNLEMKQIDGHLIQTFIINKMKDDGLAYETIKKTCSALGEIFNYALLREKIDRNPMGKLDYQKSRYLYKKKEDICLNKKEKINTNMLF